MPARNLVFPGRHHVGVSPRNAVDARQMMLLGIWIVSFTVSLDLVYEFKLFDFTALVGILAFGRVVAWNQIREDRLVGWTVAFFAVAVWGCLVTLGQGASVFWALVLGIRLFRLLGYVMIFWIIRYLPLNGRQLTRLLLVMLLACVVQSALIVLQQYDLVPLLWPEKERIYGDVGPSGTLGINHLNVVLFMSVAAACIMALWRGRRQFSLLLRLGLLGALPLMATAVVYGRARSAFLAGAALAFGAVRRLQGVVIMALTLAMVAASGTWTMLDSRTEYAELAQNKIVDKWDAETGTAAELYGLDVTRPYIWGKTVRALVGRPDVLLFGTGFQNYRNLDTGAAAGHCVYLHVLVELGVVGLIVFLRWMRSLWGNLRVLERHPQLAPSVAGHAGIMCLLTLLVVGIFNETLYPSRAVPGFMGFALAFFAIVTHRGWRTAPGGGRLSAPPPQPMAGRARPAFGHSWAPTVPAPLAKTPT